MTTQTAAERRTGEPNFADVRGCAGTIRALEVAAAARCNVLLVGPPGSGKTMLARRLAGVLPDPTDREVVELAWIRTGGYGPIDGEDRIPFRAPHHTVSEAGLVGDWRGPLATGTRRWIAPGEVSLAHSGVLFLDELPEFRRSTLERLADALRSGCVAFHPSGGAAPVWVPARPQVTVAAMNPCPCGWTGSERQVCRCPEGTIQRYRDRVRPLLPLFPVVLPVATIPLATMAAKRADAPTSAEIRERVIRARTRREALPWEPAARRLWERAAPPADGCVLADAVAKLDGEDRVLARHAMEAIDLCAWREVVFGKERSVRRSSSAAR